MTHDERAESTVKKGTMETGDQVGCKGEERNK